MSDTAIYPTHHCFDDALDYIVLRIKQDKSLFRKCGLFVVHGIAVSDDDHAYAHAWVEEGDLCWDAGILEGERIWYAVAHDEYYAARRIEKTTRYTVREASIENMRTGSYGPWNPEYLKLCSSSRRILGKIHATSGE